MAGLDGGFGDLGSPTNDDLTQQMSDASQGGGGIWDNFLGGVLGQKPQGNDTFGKFVNLAGQGIGGRQKAQQMKMLYQIAQKIGGDTGKDKGVVVAKTNPTQPPTPIPQMFSAVRETVPIPGGGGGGMSKAIDALSSIAEMFA